MSVVNVSNFLAAGELVLLSFLSLPTAFVGFQSARDLRLGLLFPWTRRPRGFAKSAADTSQGRPGVDVWRCSEWIDTAATALEAGLSLLEAFRLATALTLPSRVRDEFAHAELAFALGSTFPAALEEAALRARTGPVSRTLRVLSRAQSLGCESVQVLFHLREILQTELAATHQERVAKLPVAMLFPLAVFVLPALLILVCAPLIAQFASLLRTP